MMKKPIKESERCLFPGDMITYECTAVGNGTVNVLWRGSALRCPNDNIEIILPLFYQMNTTNTCNNGTISGKIVRVNNGTFTSQLNVILTDEIIGKGLVCAYDHGITDSEVTVGSLNIAESYGELYYCTIYNKTRIIIVVPLLDEAMNVSSMCNGSHIVFSWSPPILNYCRVLHYSITSSGCGNCPTTSTYTNITCAEVPMDSSVCRLYVLAVICLTMSEICRGVNVTIPDPVPWQLSISPITMCQSELSDQCMPTLTHHLFCYCRSKNQHCYSTGHLSTTNSSRVTTAGNFYTDMHQEMLLIFKIMVSQECNKIMTLLNIYLHLCT